MPCEYYTPAEEAARMGAKLDKLTRLLCEACKALETKRFNFDSRPDLAKWWRKHKKHDRQRKRDKQVERDAKRLKKATIAKLTKKERKALGL